jgi:hypothetical protein
MQPLIYASVPVWLLDCPTTSRPSASTIRKNPAASFSSSSSLSCSIAFPRRADRARRRPRARPGKIPRFFIVLVLVVVLDCFPRRTDRARRRPFGCEQPRPPRGRKANARDSSAPARAEEHRTQYRDRSKYRILKHFLITFLSNVMLESPSLCDFRVSKPKVGVFITAFPDSCMVFTSSEPPEAVVRRLRNSSL